MTILVSVERRVTFQETDFQLVPSFFCLEIAQNLSPRSLSTLKLPPIHFNAVENQSFEPFFVRVQTMSRWVK